MSDFDAAKTFTEAHERAEGGDRPRAPRWVPVAAAILAVLAAITGLLSTQRSTIALTTKNEAILLTTKASDAYNEYESRSIKEHLYEALIAAGGVRDPKKLHAVAEHERTAGIPVFIKAKNYEREATETNERSERALRSYEHLEVGVTFLEIAIVLVSISALVSTRLLTVVASVATVAGIVISAVGYFW
jgi:hypothetical protein